MSRKSGESAFAGGFGAADRAARESLASRQAGAAGQSPSRIQSDVADAHEQIADTSADAHHAIVEKFGQPVAGTETASAESPEIRRGGSLASWLLNRG